MSLSVSSTVSSADPSPAVPDAAPGAAESPTLDGWRNGGLTALRGELDRIDDAIHDLLMQRAEVVEHVARSGKPAAFRPGREASIIRRLLDRHSGALPPVTLVRIWREMLAGTTAMQGGLTLAVIQAGAGGPDIAPLAREHFGALTPLHAYANPAEALAAVRQQRASVAILPFPSEADPWWTLLLQHQPRLHVIARLPFWAPRPPGMELTQALVVAATPADASVHDRSLLAFECAGDIAEIALSDALAGAGLTPNTLIRLRPAGSPQARVLAEVDGHLADDDARLRHVAATEKPPVVLGTYAVPVGSDTP